MKYYMKYNNFDGINRYYQPTKKQVALQLTKWLLTGLAILLAIDFMFFVAWVASGQHPVDEFYFGSITAHILKAILF